ncbi:HNH endonuclease [Arthrobacter sp. N1]|uniref:HNH endonuclease n=1 Tax=Arthrobacter sp. N1 TaxID=619291 RepID=UPI003BB1EB8F
MPRTLIYKPCEHCGTSFTLKGSQSLAAQLKSRFCSVECRSAAGRRDVTCEHCGRTVSLKANRAANQRYCSRKCMFAALRCPVCGRLGPEERRAQGTLVCSDRCDLILALEAEFAITGELHAPCGRCRRVLPGHCFTRDKTSRNGLSNRCKQCASDYYQGNKDQYQLRRYRYQAVGPHLVVPFTPDQRDARFALWGGRCWMCGIADADQTDHVKPVSKGGAHCLANLRPICSPCNASKGGRWPLPREALQARFRHPRPRFGSAIELVTPRRPRVDWTCQHCHKTSKVRACDAEVKKYCSVECRTAARAGTTIDLTCLNMRCNRVFTLPDHKGSRHRKFCSIECAWIARNRPAHWGEVAEGQLALF